MVANPYINTGTGEIEWFVETNGGQHKNILQSMNGSVHSKELWSEYADFEREKLKELGKKRTEKCWLYSSLSDTYIVGWNTIGAPVYLANFLIDYSMEDYRSDSESNRLLKRVKFLKAVCEKEGVEWLPAGEKPRANTLRELIGGKKSIDKEGKEMKAINEENHRIYNEIEDRESEAITKGLDDLYGVNEEKEFPSTERCPHCKKCSRDYFTKEEIDEKIKELDDFDSEMLRCLSIFREHEKSKVQEEEKEWRTQSL